MGKKQELKRPDQLQTVLEQALSGIADNLTPILVGAGILLLVSLGWIGIQHNRENKLERLNLYYGRAEKEITRGMARPATDPERFAAAKKILDQLYDEARGTPVFPHVLLKLADIYQEQEMYKEAIGVLLELNQQDDLDPYIRDVVLYRLVKLYQADYNVAEAVKYARQAVETSNGPFAELVKEELKRMAGGSLNPDLTEQLKRERLAKSDIAPKQKKPISVTLP